MLTQRKLHAALASLPSVAIEGARIHGGRFTPRGSFDTLYLASDLATLGLMMEGRAEDVADLVEGTLAGVIG